MLTLIAAAPHCRTPGGKKRSVATTMCNSISSKEECSHGLAWPGRRVDRIYNAREDRKERISPCSQRLPFCVSQEMKRRTKKMAVVLAAFIVCQHKAGPTTVEAVQALMTADFFVFFCWHHGKRERAIYNCNVVYGTIWFKEKSERI